MTNKAMEHIHHPYNIHIYIYIEAAINRMNKGAIQLLLQIGTKLYKAKVLAKTQEKSSVFVINIKTN